MFREKNQNEENLQSLIDEAVSRIPPRETEGVEWFPLEVVGSKDSLATLNFVKDIIIIVDTVDFHVCVVQRHTGETTPKKVNTVPDIPTEFMNLEAVFSRLAEWKGRGFNYAETNPAPTMQQGNFNDGFRYIKIHQHPKGYLWCDMFNTSFPELVLNSFLSFPDPAELAERQAVLDRKMKFAEFMIAVCTLSNKYTLPKIRKEIREIFPKADATNDVEYEASIENLVTQINTKLKEVKAENKTKVDKPVKKPSRIKKIQDEQPGESI